MQLFYLYTMYARKNKKEKKKHRSCVKNKKEAFAKAKASFPWSKRRESNPREPAWEAGAIPLGDSCIVIIILYSAVFCNRNAYPIKKFLKKIFALSPKGQRTAPNFGSVRTLSGKQFFHQLCAFFQQNSRLFCLLLVVGRGAVSVVLALLVQQIGYGVGYVRAHGNGGGMIGADQHSERLVCSAQSLGNALYNLFVDTFNGIYFVRNVALVTAFVGRFHVDIHEVLPAAEQGGKGGVRLSCKIGVVIARGALHVDVLK